MTAQSGLSSTLVFVVPMIVLLVDGVLWALLLLVPSAYFAKKTIDAARIGHYGSIRGDRSRNAR